MKWQQQREAFSMMTAIIVIVLMASIAAFIMSLSGKMLKETTAQYQREQSMLLAKSYTEYAIMAVMANDHTSANCLNNITGNFGDDGLGGFIYTINVDISYIGNAVNLPAASGCTRQLSAAVITAKSPLNIIVDTFVRYKEFDHPAGVGAPDVVYHKRSLQKI